MAHFRTDGSETGNMDLVRDCPCVSCDELDAEEPEFYRPFSCWFLVGKMENIKSANV